jgi:hypothetical protein
MIKRSGTYSIRCTATKNCLVGYSENVDSFLRTFKSRLINGKLSGKHKKLLFDFKLHKIDSFQFIVEKIGNDLNVTDLQNELMKLGFGFYGKVRFYIDNTSFTIEQTHENIEVVSSQGINRTIEIEPPFSEERMKIYNFLDDRINKDSKYIDEIRTFCKFGNQQSASPYSNQNKEAHDKLEQLLNTYNKAERVVRDKIKVMLRCSDMEGAQITD